MFNKKVAIIIPMYNLWEEMTKPCLDSLAKFFSDDMHIFLIDNASEESELSSEQMMAYGKKLFASHFVYHRFSQNEGFATACNYGAKLATKAECEYVVFLNNDTLVTENWLAPLLDCLEDKKIGAVSPLLLFPQNGRVQHAGVSLNPLGGMRHIYYNFPATHPLVQKKRTLHYISGAVICIRASVFTEAEGFCEEYKNGVEDLDLCCTLAKKGYLFQVDPKSVVYHYGSQSIGRQDANAENFALFQSRHSQLVYDDPLIAEKDGYISCLTPELQYFWCISLEKKKQLASSTKFGLSVEICEKILEKEPYWVEGYLLLADLYEKERLIEKSCYMLELAVNFCPCIENYDMLISILQKTGLEERAIQFQRQRNNIIKKSQDSEYRNEIKIHLAELSQVNASFKRLYESFS